jgi:hypothetical protein
VHRLSLVPSIIVQWEYSAGRGISLEAEFTGLQVTGECKPKLLRRSGLGIRRGGRVVECSGLERRHTAFPRCPPESLPFPFRRQVTPILIRLDPPKSGTGRSVSPQNSPPHPETPTLDGTPPRCTPAARAVLPVVAMGGSRRAGPRHAGNLRHERGAVTLGSVPISADLQVGLQVVAATGQGSDLVLHICLERRDDAGFCPTNAGLSCRCISAASWLMRSGA